MARDGETPAVDGRETCETCGAPLSARTPEGLCPGCLIADVLGPSPAAEDEDPPAVAGPRPFGNYVLEEEVARGGMGVVFRARQLSPERTVAVKVLSGGELASPVLVARFEAETEAAARLEHPHIVPIYEVGKEGGEHFFSMRFIEGESLAVWLRRAALDPAAAAPLLATIARAVQYAHERGVLHRDIKPGNILLDGAGDAFLTDFGLAKVLESDRNLSLTGAMIGTPSYMSPEQARGGSTAATTSSDVYGLGAVFYELLSGRPPFDGGSHFETARLVVDEAPRPPAALRPAVPKDLETVCLKCLEKDASRRYASAGELADDLDRWGRGEPVIARPVPPLERAWKWARRHPARAGLVGTAAAAMVAITAGSLVFNEKLREERDTANEFRDEAEGEARRSFALLARSLLDRGVQRMEDGDTGLAQLWFIEALKLREKNGGHATLERRMIGAVQGQAPAVEQLWFAPGFPSCLASNAAEDLVAAGLFGETGLVLWDAASGGERWALSHRDISPAGLSFSPGGEVLAAVDSGRRVTLLDVADGSVKRVLAEPPELASTVAPEPPGGPAARVQFVDGGARLLVLRGASGVELWDLAGGGGAPPRVFLHGESVVDAAVSDDGRWLAACDEGGEVRVWGRGSGRLHLTVSGHRTAVHRFPFFGLGRPEGLLVCNEAAMTLDLYDLGTKDVVATTHLNNRPVGVDTHRISGGIAVKHPLDHGQVWGLAGGQFRPLPSLPASDAREVRFSPDGRLFLTGGRSRDVQVYLTGRRTPFCPTMKHGSTVEFFGWIPSGEGGRRRVVTACTDGTVRVWSLPDHRRLWPWVDLLDAYQMAFSADGGTLLSAFATGPAVVWDTRSAPGPVTAQVPLPGEGPVGALALDAAGARGVTAEGVGEGDRMVRRWDVPRRQEVGSAVALPGVGALALDPSATRVAVGADDGRVWVLDYVSGEILAGPLARTGAGAVTVLCLDATGGRVVAGGRGGEVVLYDLAGEGGDGAREVFRWRHDGETRSLCFSPDGRRVLVAAWSGAYQALAAHVLDAATGAPALLPLEHVDGVMYATFSPDGRKIATAGEDGKACIWDAATGRLTVPPISYTTPIPHLAFSPDGALIAVANFLQQAQVWDVATGLPLGLPMPLGRNALRLSFSNGGESLVTAGGGIRWIDLPSDAEPAAKLTARAQVLSGHRFDPGGGVFPLGLEELREAWEVLRDGR